MRLTQKLQITQPEKKKKITRPGTLRVLDPAATSTVLNGNYSKPCVKLSERIIKRSEAE